MAQQWSIPYAGIIRIRFQGCNLSLLVQAPLARLSLL